MPLRCAVLLIPIVLYFCNLPNGSFGAMARGYIDSAGKAEGLENAQFMATEKKDGQALELSFNELNQAAYSPRLRETWSGKEGRIRGFLEPINDHEFRLIRMKMTCCVADAVPLKARIITKDSLTARSDLSGKTWVEVTGVIQFRKLANQDTYVPVLQVETLDNIKVSEPQGNEYEVS
jgi:hypothetical protein